MSSLKSDGLAFDENCNFKLQGHIKRRSKNAAKNSNEWLRKSELEDLLAHWTFSKQKSMKREG
ncbi:hypothetical protein HUJ05_005383 [Dendroctonus ponderosae]|nr:hypothetical protein HUJ05_005383 [Dendroctonus ponderosae]